VATKPDCTVEIEALGGRGGRWQEILVLDGSQYNWHCQFQKKGDTGRLPLPHTGQTGDAAGFWDAEKDNLASPFEPKAKWGLRGNSHCSKP